MHRSLLGKFELYQTVQYWIRYVNIFTLEDENALTSVAVTSGLDKDERSVLNLTGTTYRITTCGNGSYCCGNGTYADDCCKLKHGFFLVNGSATQANPISLQDPLTSSIFSSIASFTLLTSLSISAPTKSSSEIPSSSTSSFIMFSPPKAAPQLGVMVGAAVGGAGGVVVLILCALLWKRHRRTKSNHRNEMLQPRAISSSSKPFARHRESELRLSEPHGHNRSGEMDGAGLTLELDPSTTWHQMQ